MRPLQQHGFGLSRLAWLAFALLLSMLPSVALAGEDDGGGRTPPSTPAYDWPSEVIDAFSTMPVQEGGRVKPLHTFAGFTLLRLNHKRSCKTTDGRRLDAISWLLDTMLRPDEARHYDVFVVQDGAVLDAIGLTSAREKKKKRDRYSYDEIVPARPALSRLARSHAGIDANQRSPVEAGVLKLAHDLAQFEWFLHYFDFARHAYDVSDPALSRWFPAGGPVSFNQLVPHLPALAAASRGAVHGSGPHGAGGPAAGKPTAAQRAAAQLVEDVLRQGAMARALALMPPAATGVESATWFTPSDVIQTLATGGPVAEAHLRILDLLEDVGRAADEPALLTAASEQLHTEVRRQAETQIDVGKIDLEVFLYRLDPFFWSQILFLLAFVLVAVTWLRPSVWLDRGAWTLLLGGLALTTTGIVLRCVLRGRPPISTLYETVLFVTAFLVAASLVAERVSRQRIAFSLAPMLGVLGLFVASRYEVVHGQDTMPQLVAVLDTNFWLATHVTCITIGYAAGLLTSALGHVYVLGQVFGFKRGDAAFYRNVGRMVYGMLGFALIFSIVGTILGGIWANESWGRFWGWDPKENGALLIVLTQLMILHGRVGGYLKAYGVALASVFLGCVVAFSWWHVNLLGIGLHSYGFTAGVMRGLTIFYAFEGAVLMTGLAWGLRTRSAARRAKLT